MAPGNTIRETSPQPSQPDAMKRDISRHLDALGRQVTDTKIRTKIEETLTRIDAAAPEVIRNAMNLVKQAQELVLIDPAAVSQIVDRLHADIVKGKPLPAPDSDQMKELTDKFQDLGSKATAIFETLKKQFGTFGSGILKMLEGVFGPNTALGKLFGAMKESPEAIAVYLMKKKRPNQEIAEDPESIVPALQGQVETARDQEEMTFPNKPPSYDSVIHVDNIMKSEEIRTADIITGEMLINAGKNVLNSHRAKLDAKIASLRASPPQPAAAPSATKVERTQQNITDAPHSFAVTKAGETMEASFQKGTAVFSRDAKKYSVGRITDKNITGLTIADATPAAAADIIFTLNDGNKVTSSAQEIFDAIQNTVTEKKQLKGVTAGGTEIRFEITPVTF